MLDTEPTQQSTQNSDPIQNDPDSTPRRRRAASRPAGPPSATDAGQAGTEPATAKKTTRKRTTKKAAAPAAPAPAKKAVRKRATKKSAAEALAAASPAPESPAAPRQPAASESPPASEPPGVPAAPGLFFQPPEPTPAPARRRRAAAKTAAAEEPAESVTGTAEDDASEQVDAPDEEEGGSRRRRRGGRGRRGRGKGRDGAEAAADGVAPVDPLSTGTGTEAPTTEAAGTEQDDEDAESTGSRRRRRRRRRGSGDTEGNEGDEGSAAGAAGDDDPPNTVTRVRPPRKSTRSRSGREDGDEGVRSVKGSTRLEAKKLRRREGRDAGRRRPSIITEAEFLARRESVDRVMLVRQQGERTQIAVLEDGVLAEHYVSTASSSGLAGNVYLGRVQNVLPSMEAAFVDIGKGRNAVLYAGEVNWDAAGLEGQPRRIELALKSGDPVLVQVTKDPIGHKGARLTSQVSLAGRYLVLVPGGSMTGISRKLPETERARLKAILKKVVPEDAGVIVRTAAEGASEEELSRDVARLTAQWEDIEKKSTKGSSAPALLYGEPDMTIRVVRDVFNEDFSSLVVSGDDAWDMLEPYVGHVAPDLRPRLTRWSDGQDAFSAHRVDEQLAKALDRKVWLPSGGYLVIDRTEAMIVVDVNTGKFIGQGGNLEETVTKNNLEAAEEVVRQLRLRDLGGIIVVDFIDMVLESNRDLVMRRLLECLGRDRTKHQVAEVTSLGLVQMTRKRVGQGLHESFSQTCEACNGRGFHIHAEPVESRGGGSRERRNGVKATKRGRTSSPAPQDAVDAMEASPVAAEDPVEDPVVAPAIGSEPVEEIAADPAPKPVRRRRKAVSPVTTL